MKLACYGCCATGVAGCLKCGSRAVDRYLEMPLASPRVEGSQRIFDPSDVTHRVLGLLEQQPQRRRPDADDRVRFPKERIVDGCRVIDDCPFCAQRYWIRNPDQLVEMTRREDDGRIWRTVTCAGETVHRCNLTEPALPTQQI